MVNTNSTCEYIYTTAESGHHHDYLLPALRKLLGKIKKNEDRPLRVLDIGSGNGSLSNLIAKEGYEVVGIEDSLSGINTAIKNFPECKFLHASVYEIPYADLGGNFDVDVARETTSFSLTTHKNNVKKGIEFLGEILSDSLFD